jgi:hypothetical protein
MVVLLSLGEALWSPRTYDYSMSVAPVGQEAIFTALAAAPLFAAKVPVGLMSGWLLATYCPEGDCHSPRYVWLIVGLLTVSSPICLAAFESCIREPEATEPVRRRTVPDKPDDPTDEVKTPPCIA